MRLGAASLTSLIAVLGRTKVAFAIRPCSDLCVVPDRGHVSSLYFPFRSPAVGAIRHFIRSR